ncbi:hypothetical protein, partial [Nocardioides pelophilus]|uniref:hypothetical protein n=1 Tax=Nocardioides pelophilus TaxID=2172019 RepID=UPI001FEAEBE1
MPVAKGASGVVATTRPLSGSMATTTVAPSAPAGSSRAGTSVKSTATTAPFGPSGPRIGAETA